MVTQILYISKSKTTITKHVSWISPPFQLLKSRGLVRAFVVQFFLALNWKVVSNVHYCLHFHLYLKLFPYVVFSHEFHKFLSYWISFDILHIESSLEHTSSSFVSFHYFQLYFLVDYEFILCVLWYFLLRHSYNHICCIWSFVFHVQYFDASWVQ